ncbi:hypothetical protein BH20GEM1_BH20GEM1_13510 [soil metagenome]
MSLSDYRIREIETSAERPTLEELRERLASREPVEVEPATPLAIREERDRS